jgi:tRNA threonylcarbamoyladenosine biosynthesis protein TsaE
VDFYRVESRGELESSGFSDLLEPGAVIAVEWADRFAEALPRDRLVVEIDRSNARRDPAARTVHALSCGPVSEAALVRWRAALEADAARTGLDLE